MPAHKLQFLGLLDNDNHDRALTNRLKELADYEEFALTDRTDNTIRNYSKTELRRAGTIRWGSYNARSIYGRGHALSALMVREKLGFVGIQEAWIKPLKPIQGLFKSTYPRYGANGCRGLLWVVHPDFAAFTADMSNEMPSEYHPNVLWIRVTHGDETWYAATVYLPNNTKEARETIEALVKDVQHLPEGSSVIILGDMNGDPFQRKGTTKSVLTLLFSDPRLTLVPRPNDSSFSRPESTHRVINLN